MDDSDIEFSSEEGSGSDDEEEQDRFGRRQFEADPSRETIVIDNDSDDEVKDDRLPLDDASFAEVEKRFRQHVAMLPDQRDKIMRTVLILAEEERKARVPCVAQSLDGVLLPALHAVIASYIDFAFEAHASRIHQWGAQLAAAELAAAGSLEQLPLLTPAFTALTELPAALRSTALRDNYDSDEDDGGGDNPRDAPVCIDVGSDTVKAGRAGQPFSETGFAAYLGSTGARTWIGALQPPALLGAATAAAADPLTVRFARAMERKTVRNWGACEQLLHRCFADLRAAPDDHAVLLLEQPLTARRDRELAMRLLFGVGQCPLGALVSHPVAALAAVGKTTGLVIDCGHELVQVTPVDCMAPLTHAAAELDFDANRAEFIARLAADNFWELEERGSEPQRRDSMRQLMSKRCYVALSPGIEAKRTEADALKRAVAGSRFDDSYRCGSTPLLVGPDCWRLPEVLFHPLVQSAPRWEQQQQQHQQQQQATGGAEKKRSGGGSAASKAASAASPARGLAKPAPAERKRLPTFDVVEEKRAEESVVAVSSGSAEPQTVRGLDESDASAAAPVGAAASESKDDKKAESKSDAPASQSEVTISSVIGGQSGSSSSSDGGAAAPAGLVQLVAASIARCPRELHGALWGNVVLCGGASGLRGLPERLRRDLPLVAGGHRVAVAAAPWRANQALLGAQVLTALPTFGQFWLTLKEYFSSPAGKTLIHERCRLPPPT